eukprot:10396664-Alexandrium_andersonii.AAC.1
MACTGGLRAGRSARPCTGPSSQCPAEPVPPAGTPDAAARSPALSDSREGTRLLQALAGSLLLFVD